jgi:hypothetical protein
LSVNPGTVQVAEGIDAAAGPAPAKPKEAATQALLLQIRYRLLSRCWACHRLVVTHAPAELRRCEDTPLAIVPPTHDSTDLVPASQANA